MTIAQIFPAAGVSPLTEDRRPHAVVIGAGVGGLTAGALLGARGYRVTVFDPLDAPGGRAYAHRQDGFTFDAGPTIITAPWLFEQVWAECGFSLADDVDIRPNDPFYKVRFDDGTWFSYSGDAAAMEAEIARISPEDVAGYRSFMEESRRIYEVAFLQFAETPFHSLRVTAEALAKLVRLGGYRSVHDVVAKHFRHPKLRTLFSFHPLLIGGNPFTATSFYCLIAHLESKHGVHFVMGGTNALVQGLARLVERGGGQVRLGETVETILTAGRQATGVRLLGGETVAADLVVSNCDPATTYGKLLQHHPRRRWTDAKIGRADYSMGLFLWYFGTDRRYDDVGHHTMLFGPRYRSLLDDIFRRKTLAQDFSLYLHRPSASDPSVAPPGCDAFYVLSPVPNLAGGQDWTDLAESYRARIAAHLEETLLPDLGRHVVTSRIATPLDFRDRLLSWQGAGFSFEPKLFQSAWFRAHNKSEELDNLYLCGAGTHPGAGLPGVVCSARIVANLVPAAADLAGAPASARSPGPGGAR
ncbi:phytoene desaturase [Pannonibacter tanglangensis]|uniref:Phytoene dehydrogenase n=1 Tax=Pannonibacter tanglangensis TaxID=2750084 RepID=A0ABW9ZJE4_9HYPH|nr:phytoene desaturase [Pannonibacter sp. XCT-34]NBN63137.1 phytoene desaturase [Pannonibacter sp. XCT-34]